MEEIYKEYSKIVYKYLLSLTSNTDIAEELMQETFYSAIKNINNFRNDSSLKTWLCRIAKNKWIDYYKNSKKLYTTNIDKIDENLLSYTLLEEDFANRDKIIDINKYIHKLDKPSQEVLYLRIKADFSFKEIANIMGKTEGWARIILYRAKLKLKEEIENEKRQ